MAWNKKVKKSHGVLFSHVWGFLCEALNNTASDQVNGAETNEYSVMLTIELARG